MVCLEAVGYREKLWGGNFKILWINQNIYYNFSNKLYNNYKYFIL